MRPGQSRFPVSIFLLLGMFLPCLGGISRAQEVSQPFTIGVLAKRGSERCQEKWGPTAEYLTSEIPDCSFTIVPLSHDDVYPAIERKELDFILVNPAYYVTLEMLHDARRIVTLKNLRLGKQCTVLGGVIFCRADCMDIGKHSDLRGKTFMAPHERSCGGWLAPWREFREQGIDPYDDFADLCFGGTHDAVVYAVRDGEVDAGSMRAETLERMAMEGKIRLQDFRVIREHGGSCAGIHFLHSTRAYPEWQLALRMRKPGDKLHSHVRCLFPPNFCSFGVAFPQERSMPNCVA